MFSDFAAGFGQGKNVNRQRPVTNQKLVFESLEERRLLATFLVTNSSDAPVFAVGDLPGSLRQAVFDANANPGADTIQFDPTVFTGGEHSFVRLVSGELEITDSLTIDGSTGVAVTISGDASGDDVTIEGGITDVDASGTGLLDDNSRVLNFFSNSPGDLTLSGLTITGGHTEPVGGGGGGGVRFVTNRFGANGFLTLDNTSVSGNSTFGTGADGGGIYSLGGLSLTNSSVTGNVTFGADANGGGIAVRAIFSSVDVTTLVNSTISGNKSRRGNGGGIDSLFADFSSVRNSVDTLRLINSTVTENEAGANGGGIYAYRFGRFDSPELTIMNSIVAGNTAAEISSTDVGGSAAEVGGEAEFDVGAFSSLIGVADGLSLAGNGNLLGTVASPLNPLVAPLANNGGTSLTHALLPGSPAIDAGDNSLAVDADGNPLSIDQRGPGFDRVVAETVNIGSVELVTNNPVVTGVVRDEGGVLERPDLITTFAVTFDSDVNVVQDDLTIVNRYLRTTIDTSGLSFDYDSVSRTATWGFDTVELEPAFYTFELSNDVRSTGGLGLASGVSQEVYVALQGDANLDGRVDVLNDGFALLDNIGLRGGATWALGDFDGDGDVTVLGDAFTLVRNLGQVVPMLPTFTVTNNLDGPVSSEGDLPGSLRQAIFDANLSVGAADIKFEPAVFTGGTNSLIRLTAGELEITDSVTIDGSTGVEVTISGDANGDDVTLEAGVTDVDASGSDLLDDNSRVLHLSSATADLTLTNLTVTGGRTTQGGSNDSGAGIRSVSTGSLILTDSFVSGNSTTGLDVSGGGIFFGEQGTLTISNSVVSGNVTGGSGGGIAAPVDYTAVTLNNSMVDGNSSGGSGGGVFFTVGAVVINNSTISNNSATRPGGGIFLYGRGILPAGYGPFQGSSLTLTNSTVSGNSSDGEGGGIAVAGIFLASSEITLTNSTVTGNAATFGGGGILAQGYNSAASFTLSNSIVAGNIGNGGTPNDLQTNLGYYSGAPGFSGDIYSNRSLIGVAEGLTIIGSGNLTGTIATPLDPLLGPLADNGGLPLTHALLPNSPAIDAGDNSLAVDTAGAPLSTDQRGGDFDRVFAGTVDLGAIEFGSV